MILSDTDLSGLVNRHDSDPHVLAAVREVRALRQDRDRLQERGTALTEENRILRAAAYQASTVPVQIFLQPGAHLPQYQTDGAACADLHAYLTAPIEIHSFGCVLVPTGAHVAIPPGYEWEIRGRSGMSGRAHWVATGCIDSDYRGQVFVCLANFSQWQITIRPGDRIAQAKLSPAPRADLRLVKTLAELGDTARGQNGHGSTGR